MTQLGLPMALNHDGDCIQSRIPQDFLAGQSLGMHATAIGAKNLQVVAMCGMARRSPEAARVVLPRTRAKGVTV